MKLSVTLISIFFSSTILFGQVNTTDRALDKTNRAIDQNVDKGVDKGLDAIEDLIIEKNKSKLEESNSMFGGDAEVEDGYNFDHNMLLNIDTYNKKGKQQDPMDMRMYFSDAKPNFGMQIEMEGSKNFIIYDMETYQVVSLIDNGGQKIGMAMKLNPEKIEEKLNKASKDNQDTVEYKFVKTGNSKVISGYNCDEYVMDSTKSDPEWDQSFWVTDELDANWTENMAKMAASNKMMAQKFEIPEGYPEGTIIQIVSESTKNQEKSIMTVQEYNKNQRKSFSTSGYQFMTMPSFGGN